MKVVDEAKTPSGVKLELVDWSDELPTMHKKSDTIYARPNIEGLQSRLLAFQLAGPEFARAAFEDMRRNGIARRYRKFSNDALLFDEVCEVG